MKVYNIRLIICLTLGLMSHNVFALNPFAFGENTIDILKNKTPDLIRKIKLTVDTIKSEVKTLKVNVPKVDQKKLTDRQRVKALRVAVKSAAKIEKKLSNLLNGIFAYVENIGDKLVREIDEAKGKDVIRAMSDAREIVSALDQFMQTISSIIPDMAITFMSM